MISTRHDAAPTAGLKGCGNAIDFMIWTPSNVNGTPNGTLVNGQSNGSNIIMSITACNVGVMTSTPNWNYVLDVNGTSRVGGMLIGSNMCGYGNAYVGMQHMAMSNTANSYCVLQDNNGVTYLNSAAGADLYMRVGNINCAWIDSVAGNLNCYTLVAPGVSGMTSFSNGLNVVGANYIEMGHGTSKTSDCGKIAYNEFDSYLDIVGSSTSGSLHEIRTRLFGSRCLHVHPRCEEARRGPAIRRWVIQDVESFR